MAFPRRFFFPFFGKSVPFGIFADGLFKDEGFRNDLKYIAELPDQDFSAVAQALATFPGFIDRTVLADLVARSMPSGNHKLVTEMIARLNAAIRDSSDTTEDAFKTLSREIAKRPELVGNSGNVGKVEERLRAIVAAPPGLSKQKKAESLSERTSLELSNFAIVCDARPVFDEEKRSIDGVVVVTTMRIEIQGIDGSLSAVECRLTEHQLDQLCKVSDDARRKLTLIKDLLKTKSISVADLSEAGGQK
jgi:hypothetical protein